MKQREPALDVPAAVVEIARRLEERGYATWAVGGAVRDALLGGSRADWDLATAARPETVRTLFRPSYPIGLEFGTVGVRGIDGRVYEVTSFRRDIETDGRHAVVEYADTLDEDLSRRDFTINAIAYHPLRHALHDPFDGRADLQRRTLRCVGDPARRFAEDYLRVLRGLRFAGRYGLEIDPATWTALTAATAGLTRLSGERVREELFKVLEDAEAPAGLELYRNSGALARIFPELAVLDDEEWGRTVRGVAALSPQRPVLRLALLLAPVGASGDLEEVMTRLRFSNAEVRAVTELGAAIRDPLPEPGDEIAARRWLRRVTPERAVDALRLYAARAEGGGASNEERGRLETRRQLIEGILERGDPVTLSELAIDGHDLKELGLRPGPEFGRILEACLDAVIEDPGLNERSILLERAREMVREGE